MLVVLRNFSPREKQHALRVREAYLGSSALSLIPVNNDEKRSDPAQVYRIIHTKRNGIYRYRSLL
jgi:hypothetical protein